MELIRENWKKENIEEFNNYLENFKNDTNRVWSVNLLKTKLPVLCMKTSPMKDIVNQIIKGNYLSFLDLMIWKYYENTAINGYIINEIKDFQTKKKYLDIYSKKADNWATCDLLKFNIKNNEENYLKLSKGYINSDKPFVKRIGILILFNYVNEKYLEEIFNILNTFQNEENYYVNMINAWLLAECIIKQKDKSINYLKANKLNKFTINKAIQKCRDSHRLSKEEKDMLLQYKVK